MSIWECFSENNTTPNTYIGYTTTTHSRRLTNRPYDISAIKQYIMTKHNKDTDKLKSPDIRKIIINNRKIIYKNNNKKPFTNPWSINYKNLKKNNTINKIAFTTNINMLSLFNN